MAFAAPALLIGLLALPVIWWLLRLTPPRPTVEAFPPLRILLDLQRPEETPAHSPWWLTALRLLLAALVVLALAGPILNPRAATATGPGALALVIDNGWASAPDWDARVEAASDLIGDARASGSPVALAFAADGPAQAIGPSDAATALERLQAARPRPLPNDRALAASLLDTALDGEVGTLALMTDGIDVTRPAGDDATGAPADWTGALVALSPRSVLWFGGTEGERVALTGSTNAADGLVVTARRATPELPLAAQLVARDRAGRPLAEAPVVFAAGEGEATATLDVPFELRNDFARLDLGARNTAGSVRLLDDAHRRRRVALVSGVAADLAQPLLSPLFYIDRALAPYADLVRPAEADLGEAVPGLIEREPSVIVLADVGVLPERARDALVEWVEGGGTLVRFAGPRLANASARAAETDPLLPVTLRRGERALGGALSWDEPQPIERFAPDSPFADVPVPDDVTVERQVLAEPSPDLSERTWASLADGTPLVTAARRGAGNLVLFHVTAEATWSDLPLSGSFVEMLRRTVRLSAATGGTGDAAGPLPPYRMLTETGALTAATGAARPLDPAVPTLPGPDHPPGLYGSAEGFFALNLLEDATLSPLDVPELSAPVVRAGYDAADALPLRPWLFSAAMVLLMVDTLIVLAMAGAFSTAALGRFARRGAAAGLALLILAPLGPPEARAQGFDDAGLIDLLDETRFAYVLTGDSTIDDTSRAGLTGLTRFLRAKTALEPGEPVAVDLETDPLDLFPLLYFPVDASTALPSREAVSRLDAYMKNGGSVLFDTRDQISAPPGAGFGASANMDRLRALLGGLDIPALEPVPPTHVLTKSFYLLDRFPGRYAEGDLWVERLDRRGEDASRPVTAGDGVSAVLITSNDMAGAWAIAADGTSLYPTVPNSPLQREFAFRAGVNIAMYMLTGNYKADQVHVPSLLERLGQ